MNRRDKRWQPPAPRSAREAENLALELFVAGYEGTSLPDSYHDRLQRGLAGIILFARNLQRNSDELIDVQQLCEHTESIFQAVGQAAGDEPLVPVCSVDQEGGLVARLRAPFSRYPPMARVASLGGPELCERVGYQTGLECLSAGFNVDFAPVLDINTNADNPIIGERAFGTTPDDVIAHAGAFHKGLQRSGVLGCGKHFPGHGDTETDSHLALPVLNFDRQRLERIELAPFRALADKMSLMMTAHILFPALDPKLPATLSPVIIDGLLRGHCGFDGVIVSDDLEMRGVADAFVPGECARLGLMAGVDLFLVCRQESVLDEAVEAVAKALRDGGVLANRAMAAVAAVRWLRSRLVRPRPVASVVLSTVTSQAAISLRNHPGLGTV
jgi:beta-N-acetylhexosaminidase